MSKKAIHCLSDLSVSLAVPDEENRRAQEQKFMECLKACSAKTPNLNNIRSAIRNDKNALHFLSAVFALSPYLRDCALLSPDMFVEILSKPFDQSILDTIANTKSLWKKCTDQAELMRQLRLAKRKISLVLGLADLAQLSSAEKTTKALSEFAGAALNSCCNFLLLTLHEQQKIILNNKNNPSENSGLIILGMGKFGAYELNYSSDIDIIIFFDISAEMDLVTDDPTSLFVRFAKQLSKIMQERTGEGYVFRTDLRLRPDPGSTPLAIPIETAFNYYEAYGQNWERAAFIKARPVAGDMACGQDFLKELSPFIWRKYLDFAAIQDVHSIKRQIHAHKGHGEITVKGHNIKLGRGGIREIEFFVQTQQLIAGGRRENLRQTGTIAGLKVLAQDGWIAAEASEQLEAAYWYLRNVEHRIQMVNDQQSHTLPEDDEGLERIAFMMGYHSLASFAEKIIEIMISVETHYAALFEAAPALSGEAGNLVFTGDDEDPETLETISKMGFHQPSQIISTIKGWHYGRHQAVHSAPARELLTELTPSLLEAFAGTQLPDQSLFAFDRFLAGLPASLQFFSILKSNPKLIRLITSILGSAPRLAEIITKRPNVFDALIDPSFGANIPERSELTQRLAAALAKVPAYEAKLDAARIFAAEQKFLIGIRLLNRTINMRQAGYAFSDLAETLLEGLLNIVTAEFEARHGKVLNGQIAILGMGRLGSRDLTASSDLDLIFLYNHNVDQEQSDGEKPLYVQQYFTRLVQRLIAAMSAATSQGVVYDLDFRLRPSGNSGPLATHLDSFIKYQETQAWVWERQALLRARPVAGNQQLQQHIIYLLQELKPINLSNEKISKEIFQMRKTLDSEKPASSIFDVKRAQGGLVDIEFIAQWAALIGVLKNPKSEISTSTPDMIENIQSDILPIKDLETLQKAYELYSAVLQILRVCLNEEVDLETMENGLKTILAEQTAHPDFNTLTADLQTMQCEVRNIFKALLKP